MSLTFEQVFRIDPNEILSYVPPTEQELIEKGDATSGQLYVARNFKKISKPQKRCMTFVSPGITLAEAYQYANLRGEVCILSLEQSCLYSLFMALASYPSYIETFREVLLLMREKQCFKYLVPEVLLPILDNEKLLYYAIRGYFDRGDPFERIRILKDLRFSEELSKYHLQDYLSCADNVFEMIVEFARTGDEESFLNTVRLLGPGRNVKFVLSYLMDPYDIYYCDELEQFDLTGVETIDHLYDLVGEADPEEVTFRALAKKPTNEQNTIFQQFQDVDPRQRIYYGTEDKSRFYSLEELYQSFKRLPGGLVKFSKPENPREVFEKEEIEELGFLILVDHPIKKLIESSEKAMEKSMDLLEEFHKVPKEIAREFLDGIFFCGLYMRSWKGPGYPYALRKIDTHGDVNFEKVNELLEKSKTLLEGNSCLKEFLQNFPSFEEDYPSLYELIEAVADDKFCIRVASSLFVKTSSSLLCLISNDIKYLVPTLDEIE